MRTLSRKRIYVAGLIIIFIFFLINRFTFIYNASVTIGTVIPVEELPDFSKYNYYCSAIHFTSDNTDYYFTGVQFVSYDIDEKVQVLYLKENPDKTAYVYSFMGFWYSGLLWCLLPVMFYSAFVYAFIRKNQYLEIQLKYPFVRKNKGTMLQKF